MTREEEIKLNARWRADQYDHPAKWSDTYYGFISGAKWADEHPRWISIEDEEPPKGQWIITYEPTSPIVVGTDIILPDETADEHHITHWMPLPQPPKKGD